jgi:hypothetical protein
MNVPGKLPFTTTPAAARENGIGPTEANMRTSYPARHGALYAQLKPGDQLHLQERSGAAQEEEHAHSSGARLSRPMLPRQSPTSAHLDNNNKMDL